jgi:DnaJ-class molecular chaperone
VSVRCAHCDGRGRVWVRHKGREAWVGCPVCLGLGTIQLTKVPDQAVCQLAAEGML